MESLFVVFIILFLPIISPLFIEFFSINLCTCVCIGVVFFIITFASMV